MTKLFRDWWRPFLLAIALPALFVWLFSFAARSESLHWCVRFCAGDPQPTDTVNETAARLSHCRELCELEKP